MSSAAWARDLRLPSLRQFVIWWFIVLGLVYLTAGGGGGTLGVYVIYTRIANVAVMSVALMAWLVLGLRHGFWRPRTAMAAAVIACLAALAISDLASDHPRIGLDFVAYAVLLAGGYLLLQRLFAHPFFGPRLGMLGVLLCLGISLIYIGQVVNSWLELWSQLGRVVTPPLRPFPAFLLFGNPNPIATVVILLWVASTTHLGFSNTRARWILGGLTAVAATAVFLTGSRGAWLSFAAAGLIVALLWLLNERRRQEVASLLRSRRLWAAATIAVAVLAIASVVLLPALARRVLEPAGDTRLVFATASTRMFLSSPLTGVGPGMWPVDRLRFTASTAGDLYVPHAHNVVLQTLAELGVVGILAGLVLVIALARLVRRGATSPDPLTRRLAWGVLFTSLYFFAAQMTDFFVNLPAVGFCYVLTIARLDAMVSGEGPPARDATRSPLVISAVLALAFGGATLWLAYSEAVGLQADRASNSANAGDWAAAHEGALLAVAGDPDMPPYLFTLGLAEARAGEWEAALGHLRHAAEVDAFPAAWLDVARLELDLGHRDEAGSAVREAMRLGYQEPKVALGASTIHLALGDRPAAVSALAAALIFAPGLASDPYWDDPIREPVFRDAVAMALGETDPGNAFKIALEAGRPEAAQAIIATLPTGAREVPALVARAWIGDRAAFEELHAIALAEPLSGEAGQLCRRIAERSQEPGWAGGEPWACEGTGAPGAIIVVRVNPPPSWWGILPGANAYQHYPLVYRRFVPNDDLVPGLPHLGSRLT